MATIDDKMFHGQAFNETYFLVRYQEDADADIHEEIFRSRVKAWKRHDALAGEGYRVWVEQERI